MNLLDKEIAAVDRAFDRMKSQIIWMAIYACFLGFVLGVTVCYFFVKS